jgi:hypothetical protein
MLKSVNTLSCNRLQRLLNMAVRLYRTLTNNKIDKLAIVLFYVTNV